MGGSKSQPKKDKPAAQAQSSMEPMLAYMAMQQQQQSQQASADAAAAAEAQAQSQIQAQAQAGQQAQMQGEQAAKQALGGMNTAQQAQDAAIVSQQAGGASATGGGFDVGQARQQSLQQMGVQPTMTTASGMSNQGVGGTQQSLNKFVTPATTGLTFGGS